MPRFVLNCFAYVLTLVLGSLTIMTDKPPYLLWTLRALLVLWAVFVAMASLAPFNFSVEAMTPRAVFVFFDANPFRPHPGRASLAFDAGMNVLLFLPLGFGLWFHNLRAPIQVLGVSRLMALAVAYGIALQALQLFLPRRTASLSDAVWNAVGLGVGLALAWLFWKIGEEVSTGRARGTVA